MYSCMQSVANEGEKEELDRECREEQVKSAWEMVRSGSNAVGVNNHQGSQGNPIGVTNELCGRFGLESL